MSESKFKRRKEDKVSKSATPGYSQFTLEHNQNVLKQLRRLSKYQIHNFTDLFRLTSQERTLH